MKRDANMPPADYLTLHYISLHYTTRVYTSIVSNTHDSRREWTRSWPRPLQCSIIVDACNGPHIRYDLFVSERFHGEVKMITITPIIPRMYPASRERTKTTKNNERYEPHHLLIREITHDQPRDAKTREWKFNKISDRSTIQGRRRKQKLIYLLNGKTTR